ncbi:Ent-kaurene synthase 5, chloroplastic-like protein [Drosera capensis]
MSLSSPSNLLHLHGRLQVKSSAVAGNEPRMMAAPASSIWSIEDGKERIRKMFDKVELSVSAYDTAWVAMVPSRSSQETPCFPGTVDWILSNQLPDGSWGLPDRHPLLVKDALSSTLACVLALKRWLVGEDQMTKGLDFIRSNFASAMDEEQHSPVGFDVIFPTMIDHAINLDVNFHFPKEDVEAILRKKDFELERIKCKSTCVRNHYLAFISEGLGELQDWEMAMTYQRNNGSILNSPSATAAALLHLHDSSCHGYLCSVLQRFGTAVPAVYPSDMYARLRMVDKLQRLGIDRHFTENIRNVLDEAFRLWIQGHEDLFSDIATSALSFRILRLLGYGVSSKPLKIFGEQECTFDRFGGHLKDINDALELFKASELVIDGDDLFLQKQNSWSRSFLTQQLDDPARADGFAKSIIQEVNDALKNPFYASLEHLANRRCIERCNLDNISVHKSSFRFRNLNDDVLLKLAVEDFNHCQSIHVQELTELKQWYRDNKLDQLSFSRQKLSFCYFAAASTIFSPELADARLSWAKNGVLTTVVDDFFDVGSSVEEQLDFIQLVEQWNTKDEVTCCSEKVQMVFSALHRTVSEITDQACRYQDRNVALHVYEVWHRLIKSMWREAEMSRENSVPTMEEYLENAYISFALGPIVLPALYLLGLKLSQEAIRSEEYNNLYKFMSTCGRLLNDVRGFEREAKEGKLNAVSLYTTHGGADSIEEAVEGIQNMAVTKRRELLRLVLQREDSVVPWACKDLFWKMSKVLHLFYGEDDGFTSEKLGGIARGILQDPIVIT